MNSCRGTVIKRL
nr:unnamed protein product [Callosobruchus analis]